MVILASGDPGGESVDALKVAIGVNVDEGDDRVDCLSADDSGEGGLMDLVEVVVEVLWRDEFVGVAVASQITIEGLGANVVQDLAIGDFEEERADVAGEAGLKLVDDGRVERVCYIEAVLRISRMFCKVGKCQGKTYSPCMHSRTTHFSCCNCLQSMSNATSTC